MEAAYGKPPYNSSSRPPTIEDVLATPVPDGFPDYVRANNYRGSETFAYGDGYTALSGGACLASGACSFSGDTHVLMADGSSKAIKDVKVGDQVEASDPITGEEGVRTVTNLWIHEDSLQDLRVGDHVLTTTEDLWGSKTLSPVVSWTSMLLGCTR